jgi:energy-coupling factor transport system substrate-specific component
MWVVAFALLNSGLDFINQVTVDLPLFLDTIGTLLSTALFGLIPGLATAVLTHGTSELLNTGTASYLPWMAVSMSSALVLWLLARRGRFETAVHAVMASLWLSLANAFVGALIAVAVFGGKTDHAVDFVATAFYALGRNELLAAFLARLPVNLVDKAIGVAVTFIVLWLVAGRREGADERAHAAG